MNVLVVEPMRKPYNKEIDGGLESLQREVGGCIEAHYPFTDPWSATIFVESENAPKV